MSVEGTAEVDEEDGQGDFPVRGCRCVTWSTAVTLKEPQLTLSWESMGTHGNAFTLQGKEGESTGEKSYEVIQILGTFKPERERSSSHLLSLDMLAKWFL